MYYIHGLNTTGEVTLNRLSTALNQKIKMLDWNEEFTFLDNFSRMLLSIKGKQILIGSSLGGFYAYHLSNYLECPCVLINPVMNPKKSYKRLNIHVPFHMKKLVNSYFNVHIMEKDVPRLIILGMNDDILDPIDTYNYWKNKCKILTCNEGHTISDFKPFANDILSSQRKGRYSFIGDYHNSFGRSLIYEEEIRYPSVTK